MFTSTLAIATILATSCLALPHTIRPAPPSSFASAGTTPADSFCGTPGDLPYSITSDPNFSLRSFTGIPNAPDCASHCLSSSSCTSFSYNQINGSCALFTESLDDMGFHRTSGAVFWWDRVCFERHGDWAGRTEEKTHSRKEHTTEAKTKVTFEDAIEDVLTMAIVRRPSELHYARTRWALEKAAVQDKLEKEDEDHKASNSESLRAHDVSEYSRKMMNLQHIEQVKLDRRTEGAVGRGVSRRWSAVPRVVYED